MFQLSQVLIFLAAAVIMVPLFRKFGFGAVLGYLVAGVILGPYGFKLVSDVESILHFSELGVVFLLFVIGLELQPSRLWVLRRSVFGLGSAQVLLTALALIPLLKLFGLNWSAAVTVGFGLSMSSTAFVLQSLAERNQLVTRPGREAFAILLFQDIAVIPLLALLPLLAPGGINSEQPYMEAFKAVAAVFIFILGGRFLLKPLFKFVALLGSRESFTAAALLVVVGIAAVMNSVGLSMARGSFLAGVLLADSEFRHELEADIEPFKGLLLGLFFMAVGMSANLNLLTASPIKIVGLVLILSAVKFLVLFGISFFAGAKKENASKLGLNLAQGGEFAFVVFAAALTLNIFDAPEAQLWILVVTLSMLLAPFLILIEEKWIRPILKKSTIEPEYDKIEDDENPVVIAGFGRFGQIVARLLTIRKIRFTALEKSAEQVNFVRKFGNKIHYGDASRLDLLQAAKVDKAKLFVLAIDDVDSSLKTAEMVKRHFPNVPIFARARNRFHCYKLLDLGVKVLMRETYLSSIELAREVLKELGLSEKEALLTVERFREYDENMLLRQHAVYQNEELLIQTAKQAFKELENLFEIDKRSAEEQSDTPYTTAPN